MVKNIKYKSAVMLFNFKERKFLGPDGKLTDQGVKITKLPDGKLLHVDNRAYFDTESEALEFLEMLARNGEPTTYTNIIILKGVIREAIQ